jgi:beta-glucosidase
MSEEREKKYVFSKENLDAARDVAKRSLVLLKNDKNILPLRTQTIKIAIVGPLADANKEMLGGWHAAGDGDKAISLLTAMKGTLKTASITHVKGCEINTDSRAGFAEAVAAAKNADVVIVALGEANLMSAEAKSRSNIKLPGVQEEFLAEIRKAGKPVVVVLFNGRPLDLSAVVPNADAILEAWFPGTMAGWAVADVLTGAYNPSGHLTITVPRSIGQVPIFYNMKNTGRPMDPNGEYTSKYLDIPNDPLFPFGFGLSYSMFTYSPVELSKNIMMMDSDSIRIRATVTNTSKMDGEEVVQLYVRDLAGSVTRPVKELKGFRKVMIPAGQAKVVDFSLSAKDLRFIDENMRFTAEKGKFHVWVAPNSAALGTPTVFEIR